MAGSGEPILPFFRPDPKLFSIGIKKTVQKFSTKNVGTKKYIWLFTADMFFFGLTVVLKYAGGRVGGRLGGRAGWRACFNFSFLDDNLSLLWPIYDLWVSCVKRQPGIAAKVSMIKVNVTVVKNRNLFSLNNLSLIRPIDARHGLWVAYIKRQLGIAPQVSVIKVNVTKNSFCSIR